LVKEFRLRPILECENLEEVYFNGIYYSPFQGGKPGQLEALEDLRKWIIKGFLMGRWQKVQVELARRCDRKYGRVTRAIVTLNEEELEPVATMAKVVKGEFLGPADVGARCAYPLLM
jgi:hypothetical protein